MRILLFLLSFLIITSCGYKSIISTKENTFSMTNIELIGDRKINLLIQNHLQRYKKDNSEKNYDLKIKTVKNINIASKNNKGNSQIFSMIISIEIEVEENNKLIGRNNFSENFSYKNTSNKFELKKYEKNVQKDLTEKLVKNLVTYLHSL
jgi:hypothetical protein